MDFEKVALENIAITDPEMCLVLFRSRGAPDFEGQVPRTERVTRGINTADSQWYLFCALRDRILELEGRLSKLEPAKAAKKARTA